MEVGLRETQQPLLGPEGGHWHAKAEITAEGKSPEVYGSIMKEFECLELG